MQEFEPKKSTETRVLTYVMPYWMRQAGRTFATVAAAATVDPDSQVADVSPSAILNGAATVSIASINVRGTTIALGQAILIPTKAGTVGARYIITLTMILDTGETFVEDCKLLVAPYVPTP